MEDDLKRKDIKKSIQIGLDSFYQNSLNKIQESNEIQTNQKELEKSLIYHNIFEGKKNINDTSVLNLEKDWKELKNKLGHVNTKHNLYLTDEKNLNILLKNLNIRNNFILFGKEFNRDKFLEMIETYESEIVVYILKNYYNFIQIGISCKILLNNITISQNNQGYLLLNNEKYYILINKWK